MTSPSHDPLDRVSAAWRDGQRGSTPPTPSTDFDASVLAAVKAAPVAADAPTADLLVVWRFAAAACILAGVAAALAVGSQAHDFTSIAWDLGTAVGGEWPTLF